MRNVRERIRTKQTIGVVLALVFTACLIHLLLSPWVKIKLLDGFYLGFFPVLGMMLLVFLSLIVAFDSHRKEIPTDLRTLTLKSFLSVLLLLGGAYFYFVVMREIGFLVITHICLFPFIYALGLRPLWKAILGGIVMTAVVYTFFTALGLRLPPGILSGILPF